MILIVNVINIELKIRRVKNNKINSFQFNKQIINKFYSNGKSINSYFGFTTK
jgi:hypothetical protein